MKKGVFSLLFLSACTPGAGGELSQDLQAVLDVAVYSEGGSEADTLVYRVGALSPGSLVEPLFSEDDLEPFEVIEETALFLVDPLPDARWAKPVRWVYVDADGDVHNQEADWFPVVDEEAFDPVFYDAEWGEGGEARADIEEQSSLQDEARRSAGPPPPPGTDDPCEKQKVDLALTISAWDEPDVRADELNMSIQLKSFRGFEVTRVTARQPPATIKRQIQSALNNFAGREAGSIDELVIFYAGHGAPVSGSWVLGTKERGAPRAILPAKELARLVAPIPADRLTIISDSCYSGAIAAGFEEEIRKLQGADDMEVRFIHSASATQIAWGTGTHRGGEFTLPFTTQNLLSIPRGQDVDWDTVPLPGPFSIRSDGLSYTQTPGRRFSRPNPLFASFVPEGYPPVENSCVEGYLDEQTYDREVRIKGRWFGDEEGTVRAEDANGQLQTLKVAYWSDTNVIVHLPMRRDGFPSEGHSPSMTTPKEGQFRVEVERKADNRISPQEGHVQIELQRYTRSWTPDYSRYEYPAWLELWHPMTPASDWTKGATVQVSSLYDSEVDLPPEPELSDIAALHRTSTTVQSVPYWGYELFPAARDLKTAYEQSYPAFNYYGFRLVFGEDFRSTVTWNYTLMYD